MLKALAITGSAAAKNFLFALLTRKMVVLVMRKYAETTETLVDDRAVDLIEAGMNNDPAAIHKAVSRLADAWTSEKPGAG